MYKLSSFIHKGKSHSGVYCIENSVDKKCYVGSSVNILNRLYYHRWDLLNNTHHSKYLQRDLNKHGIDNFQVKLLEMCTEDLLIAREIHWIGKLKPAYNMCKVDEGRILKFSYEMRLERSKLLLKKKGFSLVQMLDKNTEEVLAEFTSLWEAAGFILYNGLSRIKINNIIGKISDIINGNKIHKGVRRNVVYNHCYGYKWRYV